MSVRAHHRGFSLLEMLVAIGLLVVLVSSMFAFLFDMLSARRRALETVGRQLAATTLIDSLERDLIASLVGDATTGAGIDGDNERLRVLTRGVAGSIAERGAADPDVLGDLQEVEYRFDLGSGRIEGRRGPAGDPGSFSPLGGQVARVRFRYNDGQRWQDSFDSRTADALPVAVEVMVWFVPWPGDEPVMQDVPNASGFGERSTFDAVSGFD